ncbi:protein of unknown function [Thauera humireducens]|nr:protein of unknown function [Thauera humireducens]
MIGGTQTVTHIKQHSELLPYPLELEGRNTHFRSRTDRVKGTLPRAVLQDERRSNASRMRSIACEGLKPFGQTSVQFMIVRQR